VLELDRLFTAAGFRDLQRMRAEERRVPLDVGHLAMLGELAGAAGQPLDDVVLELAQLAQVDFRLAEFDAPALACRDSSTSLATCSSAFDGMQPR
jgi:hypothetical protein